MALAKPTGAHLHNFISYFLIRNYTDLNNRIHFSYWGKTTQIKDTNSKDFVKPINNSTRDPILVLKNVLVVGWLV